MPAKLTKQIFLSLVNSWKTNATPLASNSRTTRRTEAASRTVFACNALVVRYYCRLSLQCRWGFVVCYSIPI